MWIWNLCVKVFDWNSISLCPPNRRRSEKNAKARTGKKESQRKPRRTKRTKTTTVKRRTHLRNLQRNAKRRKSSVVKSWSEKKRRKSDKRLEKRSRQQKIQKSRHDLTSHTHLLTADVCLNYTGSPSTLHWSVCMILVSYPDGTWKLMILMWLLYIIGIDIMSCHWRDST